MLALVNWEVHFIPPQAVHFKDMRLELSGSPVLVTASGEYGFLGNGSYMYINFNDEDFPREDVDCFLMGRGLGKCKYEIACIEHSVKPLVGRDGYGRGNVCYLHG